MNASITYWHVNFLKLEAENLLMAWVVAHQQDLTRKMNEMGPSHNHKRDQRALRNECVSQYVLACKLLKTRIFSTYCWLVVARHNKSISPGKRMK